MAIARRNLLGIGAAVALTAGTASCRDRVQGVATETPTAPGSGTPGTPAPSGMPPAPGTLYYGASVPYHRSLPAWEKELGAPLALHRSYFTPDANETKQLVARCRHDLARGRLPHVSIKPEGTWQSVASGERDDWLISMLGSLGEDASPVLFTLNHEPENDAGPPGMEPSDYVAMQRRVIDLAAELAPQTIVVPVLRHWTFDPMHDGGDPSAWIVPEASAVGVDLYNPWSPTNGKPWRTFASKLIEVSSWFGDMPLVVGEYGCREDPQAPGRAAEWLHDAADHARTHNVMSMSYFNSGVNAPEGSWELTGEAEAVFAELLASDWVARPV